MLLIRFFISIIVFFSFLSPLAAEESPAKDNPPPSESRETSAARTTFKAVYDQGHSPLKTGVTVNLSRDADKLAIVPDKKNVTPWILPIDRLRGATPTEQGVWLYWFDDADNTVNAYFKGDDKDKIASLVNSMVSEFYNNGGDRKKRIEEYQKKALQDSQ